MAGAAGGPHPQQPRLHPAGKQAERGALLHARGAARPLYLEDYFLVGHLRARGRAVLGAQAHHVRVARRADQLHHRRRIPQDRLGGLHQLLAGAPPHGGQGHPPLPRHLLAGLSDGGQSAAPQICLRARLVDEQRGEDVQVAGQRHRPGGARPQVRHGPGALLHGERGGLWLRRRLLRPKAHRLRQRQARQRIGQPRLPHHFLHLQAVRRANPRTS
mmetsp:Transcript_27494/g.59171  ORF Transcript_27494/g.59171 Transcript_27494/m.59171 type:complete len:216 (+) Transcript_27494:705-1352(+)